MEQRLVVQAIGVINPSLADVRACIRVDCKLVIFHSPPRGRGRLLQRQTRVRVTGRLNRFINLRHGDEIKPPSQLRH